ncbi:phage major capsid protein [Glutamicibacter arilaitensis]|uniref:phage major capsid protein n=1 Tax=Glutamicibacter arilaitensis TaxID=256701 RepID=UPI0018660A5E|nr:phage major capsid protein [Glutamicibacter arilaitensis]
MNKFEQLKAKAMEHAKNARELAEKADNEKRVLTASEQDAFDGHIKSAGDLAEQAKEAKYSAEIEAKARALANEIGGAPSAKSAGPVGRKAWGRAGVKTVRESMGRVPGSKALVSGTVSMANPVSPSVAALGAAPLSVLALLMNASPDELAANPYNGVEMNTRPRYEDPLQQAAAIMGGDGGGSNTYSYLRQTVRDNKAAPVADGATKPTSVYTFKEIEDRYRVIAHVSEPLPQRFFHDDATLGQFLGDEMGYGLQRAVEAQALSGDGLGENFTGLLNASGINSQAWASDLLTTLRKAVTTLQGIGSAPTALVLNPVDAERVDLLREGVDSGKYLIGDPAADSARALWEVPRVTSVAVPAGTAVLGDWDRVDLLTRQEATLHVDTGGALFDKNQVKFRVEGRFGLEVKQPDAFVKIDIAEPAA